MNEGDERGTSTRTLRESEVHHLVERCRDLEARLGEETESRRLQQELFNREISRMANIISNIMDGIVYTDADGCIALMNPVAEELLGLRAFMTVGKSLFDLPYEGELLDAIREECKHLKDWRENSRVVEVHHSGRDLLYIRMRVSRVHDYRGESAGLLIQLTDVTAEHKTDQLKNQYLSIVAHELRTPLTGIKTFSTMMAKGTLGSMTEQQVRVVESIREQSLRLEHQIDKLINLGHIESNEYGQDLEFFDVSELIRQATVPFEQLAKDRSIELDVQVLGGERMVEGDRADLRRAVQALVENAIKFSPDHGKVLVEVMDAGPGTVEINVSDNGVGIDPRYHRRIFEKFFQVEDPLTRHHGGSGLGLFFVRSIVDAHGSSVQVQSRLGAGAKFSFVLQQTAPTDLELDLGATAGPTTITQ